MPLRKQNTRRNTNTLGGRSRRLRSNTRIARNSRRQHGGGARRASRRQQRRLRSRGGSILTYEIPIIQFVQYETKTPTYAPGSVTASGSPYYKLNMDGDFALFFDLDGRQGTSREAKTYMFKSLPHSPECNKFRHAVERKRADMKDRHKGDTPIPTGEIDTEQKIVQKAINGTIPVEYDGIALMKELAPASTGAAAPATPATVGLEEEDPAAQAAPPKTYYYCDASFSTTEPPEFQLLERLVDAQTKDGLVSSIMNSEITVPKSSMGDAFSGVREMEAAGLPPVGAADKITIYKSTYKGLVKPKQGLQVVISK